LYNLYRLFAKSRFIIYETPEHMLQLYGVTETLKSVGELAKKNNNTYVYDA